MRACASSSLSALAGIVYNRTQRRVYIFVFCVFFTCSSRSTCYPVRLSQNVLFCLPASTSASASALASACLGLLVVITRVICVSFPPSGRPAKKQNDVLWRHVTCVIYVTPTPCCRSWWLLFFFSTCNVLQAKKKWVLAAVQNCDTKRIGLTIEILYIFYFGIAKEASSF